MLLSGNLRRDYEFVKKLEKLNEEKQREILANEKMIKFLKEGIRNTLRERERREERAIYKWNPYRGYWDERYCKIVYDGIPTEDEIEEYIKDEWCHWYNPYEDGRDCTGVWFTSSIRVFPIPAIGKTIVYHFQSCDV